MEFLRRKAATFQFCPRITFGDTLFSCSVTSDSLQPHGLQYTIYTPNIGAPQYISQMLASLKGEINSNTVTVGDFNTPLTPMHRSTKQKISKEIQALNDTMELDLIDIYRVFHPKSMEFTFFSRAHGTFSRIDQILGHKSSFGKF